MRTIWLEQEPILACYYQVFQNAGGLIIVSGCAHHGIINTIHNAKKITGKKSVHTVIGVSHCTGLNPAMPLSSTLGERFFFE